MVDLQIIVLIKDSSELLVPTYCVIYFFFILCFSLFFSLLN